MASSVGKSSPFVTLERVGRLIDSLRRLLPGLWAGGLLCLALIATPALFALLDKAQAVLVAARLLQTEAFVSLALGVALLVLERLRAREAAAQGRASQFSTGMVLALGTLFCTVLGYFVMQPVMALARSGGSSFSPMQAHVVSVVSYAIKTVLVLWMSIRALGAEARP